MRLLRLLPERWQKLVHEAFKFGIVGGINLVINYAVFNALALSVFRDGQLKATVVATIVATISSYLMNRHWTYRDRRKSAIRRESALFFLFNAVGLVIEVGVLGVAKYGLGLTGLLTLNIAKTFGVVLATLFRFWSYRTFVFQVIPAAAADAEQPPGAEKLPDTGQSPATGQSSDEVSAGEQPDLTSTVELPKPADPEFSGEADDSAIPLELQFADTLNVELEAELATELNADLATEVESFPGRRRSGR